MSYYKTLEVLFELATKQKITQKHFYWYGRYESIFRTYSAYSSFDILGAGVFPKGDLVVLR